MKNEIKLLVVSFVFIIIMIIITYSNYQKSHQLHHQLIEKTIKDTVKKVKFDIDKTDSVIKMVFEFKTELFKSIHKQAIEILQKDPNISLNILKAKLDKQLPKSDIRSHLYLINKDYIIYDTTYKKDMGLDMKLFKGASKDIDFAYEKHPDILIAPPSIDALNKEYRIYSYGVVDKEKKVLLEMGFFDSSISKLKKEMYQFNSRNSLIDSIDIFGDYQNYIINLNDNINDKFKTKQELLLHLKQNIDSPANKIIKELSNSGKTYTKIETSKGKTYKIVYTVIKHIKISQNGYKNYVVKLKFDITDLINDENNMKLLFYISLMVLIVMFLIFIVYLRKSIINPMDETIEKQYSELQELNKNLEEEVEKQVVDIKKSHQKFETVFNTVKDGIAILDKKSNFIVVNNAYCKLTGLTKEQLYKTSCIKLTSEDYIQASKDAMKKANEIGYCYNFEKVYVMGDRKKEIVMDLVKMPHTNEILTVTKDITGEKSKERKILEQSRQAQMGEMISMIAHQWRQPLGAISSAIISVQNKLSLGKFDLSQEDDRVKFEKFLYDKTNHIEEYIDFLSTTIDEFRNFYKKDKQLLTFTTSQIVQEVLKIVQTSMENKNITIDYKLDDTKDLKVYKNELMQVVLNILKNSEDNFVEKDIKNQTVKITTKLENNSHKIIISDNGGGIPNDILPKIFEPYFSTKQEKNGTGLGLYMSKTIIEEHHNGKFEVRNIEDGVEFIIVLGDIS